MPLAPRSLVSFAGLCTLVGLAGAAPEAAHAGPPFVTDDPEPTDLHKWEIYNFVSGTHENGVTSADFGVDLNYGAVKDVQITATLPLHVETGQPVDTGDVELAVKVKFLHQKEGSLVPDLAVFPRVFLPTGRGSSRAQVLLPLWAQKDWGKWSLFGGGGYMLNPGPGNRNYPQWGLVLNRQVRAGWQLGLEYYGASRASDDERFIQGVNLATTIHLKGPFSLLGAFGQGLNRRQTIFYSALKLDL